MDNLDMSRIAAAQRNYDRAEPVEIVAEDWPTRAAKFITDSDVEAFIAQVAESGSYENDLGFPQRVTGLYLAVARQWVKDSAAVGEIIGPEFWKWAKSAAYAAA